MAHAEAPVVAGMFYGIQPAVIALVAEAVLRIGRSALRHPGLYAFAAAAFTAIYFFSVPFPLIVLAAALAGLLLEPRWPQVFTPPATASQPAANHRAYPPTSRAFKIAAIFVLLWAIPVGALWLWRGGEDVLIHEALFFTKAAFVTFGGAYAVLSYIADVAVNDFRWLSAEQMVQGLGLAESTPGPLIMVTQYVGFLGAWKFHGSHDPLGNAVLGALVTTYVTFVPCFFFIFAFSPYIEALAGNRRLQAALTGVTAAVVGVVLNLAVFFGTRVLLPRGAGLDGFALLLASACFLVLWRFRVPIHLLVPASALAGLLWRLVV